MKIESTNQLNVSENRANYRRNFSIKNNIFLLKITHQLKRVLQQPDGFERRNGRHERGSEKKNSHQ